MANDAQGLTDTETANGAKSYGYRSLLSRLFGVRLVSDVHCRLTDFGLPIAIGRWRRNNLKLIDDTGLLFIHVPKTGGMAMSAALYGRQIRHMPMRYYHRIAPRLARRVMSFAMVRDPVDRFVSAYRYGRAGGTRDRRISIPFRSLYRSFRSVDQALDHVEDRRSIYDIDHIFRPQSWYVTDGNGDMLVDAVFRYEDMNALCRMLDIDGGTKLPRLNGSVGAPVALSADQVDRIMRLYADDYRLISATRAVADRA